MRKVLLLGFALSISHCSYGQKEKNWSIEAGIGGLQMLENRYDDGANYVNEDQGNAFFVSADYWLSHHFALTGGATFEQQGLYTDYSDGIGLKKVNLLGLHAGAKYYFFPRKWIFQPHIGTLLHTNVLNLGHQLGECHIMAEQGFPGCHATMTYDVSCPALSLSPQIGMDIHLFSSVSFCVAYSLRFGLWGSNKASLRFTDGPVVGQIYGIDERNNRSCVSVGLKMDIPMKTVSEKAKNNFWMLLHDWISSKARD